MLEIVDPGMMSAVQDIGRVNGQALGIPPSGAQDPFALRLANLLVGNDDGGPLVIRKSAGHAGIEMSMIGATFKALSECVVAIAGADMSITVNGAPAQTWTSILLAPGDVLEAGIARSGLRAYLAVAGGIDVPPYLGSRATHVRGGFGGLDGRLLKAGDRLPIGATDAPLTGLANRRVPEVTRPHYTSHSRLHVILGPDDRLFTEESVQLFFDTEWRMNTKADRTGFRFIGPSMSFRPGRPDYLIQDAGVDPSNIVIDPGAPVGTIQVPSGAEPIVLGVDSPSIGGYARIGVVISTDMSTLGQIRPNGIVRFVAIDHAEAVERLLHQEAQIDDVRAILELKQ